MQRIKGGHKAGSALVYTIGLRRNGQHRVRARTCASQLPYPPNTRGRYVTPVNQQHMPMPERATLIGRQGPMRINRDVSPFQCLGCKRPDSFIGDMGRRMCDHANAGASYRLETFDESHACPHQCKKQARNARLRVGRDQGEVAGSSIEWRGDDSFFNSR